MSERAVELPNRRATVRLAQALAPHLGPGDLLVLGGELGAGKTFFVRALCRGLGVPTAERVQSPTFSICHELTGRLPIVHADLYRLADPRELTEIGLYDRRAEGALLLVEWGLTYAAELGGDALAITFALQPVGRSATLAASGPRSSALLERSSEVPPRRATEP